MNEDAQFDWPLCPRCDKPRITRCEICGTAGADFEPADMGFDWVPGKETPEAKQSCGSCSSGGCGGHGHEEADAAEEPIDESAPAIELLMCHTCDEPFPPIYARRCEWCGHEYGDGYEVDDPAEPLEPIDSRVIWVGVGLAVVMIALFAFFFASM